MSTLQERIEAGLVMRKAGYTARTQANGRDSGNGYAQEIVDAGLELLEAGELTTHQIARRLNVRFGTKLKGSTVRQWAWRKRKREARSA
jgi:hypothetical protein